MVKNVTLELKSECPIEIVYGLSSATLEAIRAENPDAEGYDWCSVLDNRAEQREEFLSGIDVDDAQLIVFKEDGVTSKYKFVPEAFHEDEEDLGEIILYNDASFTQAGVNLHRKGVDYIVVVRLELKFRSWKFTAKMESEFSKDKISIKIKNRDSDLEIASEIYSSWDSIYESSITDIYYDGERIPFHVDFTSHAPEFLCLRKTSRGWLQDKNLEYFFTGTE
ncbi:hypothetical protein LSUCC0031_02230 [Rhodobacterales bacterium LSUCC0031]|nr:hypothetical protein [Rhodobacterales bacterium LSUCC0031]